MAWKLKLTIALGVLLMYFSYVQTNISRATAGVDHLRAVYSSALRQADQINTNQPSR